MPMSLGNFHPELFFAFLISNPASLIAGFHLTSINTPDVKHNICYFFNFKYTKL